VNSTGLGLPFLNWLSVHFPSVTDTDDEDDKARIHELCDDPIIANPVVPQISETLPFKGLANGPRIVKAHKSFVDEAEDAFPDGPIEPVKIVGHIWREFNRPGHRSGSGGPRS